MPVQVLFIQGGGEGAHDTWDNKLVDDLKTRLGPGYEVRYPRMPDEADPNYGRWKTTIEQELAALPDGSILAGHSIGATMLINTLVAAPSRHKPAGIFLIAAPFIGEGGWPSDEINPRKDLGSDLPAGVPIRLYHGSSDATAPVVHVELYANAIPQAVVRRLNGRDHQLNNDLSEVADDIRALALPS